MKMIIYFLSLLTIPLYGQNKSGIGIGTEFPKPGTILHIEATDKGILLPRFGLKSLDSQDPIEGVLRDGLIVYNTDTSGIGDNSVFPGFYVWNAQTESWGTIFKPVVRSIAKYVNVDKTTDFNNGANIMNIFDEEIFNENPSLYEKFKDGVKIHDTGLYKFTLNLDLDGTSDRDIFAIDGFIDNKKIPETFFVSTVDNALGSNQDIGYVFTTYVSIPKNENGAYVYFMGREIDGQTQVYFKDIRTSSITIEKIR